MTTKQEALINEFIEYLPEDEKWIFKEIVCCFTELGYVPQKQKVQDFVLSFKHNINGKVIAKAGIRKQKGFLGLKFFACKDVPEKYIKALQDEAVANENRYSRPVPPPDSTLVPSNVIMKKCTSLCSACTGGGMRYYYQFPDRKEIFRCSAYPVPIPDIRENDIGEMKRIIVEQHNYFLSIA